MAFIVSCNLCIFSVSVLSKSFRIPNQIQIAVALDCLGNSDQNWKSTSVQYRHKYFPCIVDSCLIKAADAGPEGSEGHLCSGIELAAASGSRRLTKTPPAAGPESAAPAYKAETLGDNLTGLMGGKGRHPN